MTRTKTPLHPSMGAQVLRRLALVSDEFDALGLSQRVNGEKDAEVFVAGQAVASALSQLFGDGSGVVYNDIDAFVISERLADEYQEKRRGGRLATLDYSVADLVTTRYGGLMVTPMSVYGVVTTERAGMLNTVVARPFVHFGNDKARCSDQFLSSFDLNCVQVAVRLSDGQLVWTRAFEQFWDTRQMLVMNPKTPLHTAVRYLRKKRELEGVFGNDEQTMELLTAAQLRIRARVSSGILGTKTLRREAEAQLSMGKMYASKARALGSDLSEWFDLEETDAGPVQLFTLKARHTPDERLLEESVDSLLLPTYARALRGHWKRHVCESIVNAVGLPHTRYARMAVSVHGERAFQTQEAQRATAKVDQLLRQHSRTEYWLSLFPPSAHADIARAIRAAEKRHGTWAIGVFETQMPQDLALRQMRENVHDIFNLASAWVDETIERFQREEQDGSVKHRNIVPDIEVAGYRVRELWTLKDLTEEGVRMAHCVGGYVGAVREGSCHILSLRKPRASESVTVQVHVFKHGLTLGQVHGMQNRYGTDAERALAQRLVHAASLFRALSVLGVKPSPASFLALLGSDRAIELARRLQALRNDLGRASGSNVGKRRLGHVLRYALVRLRTGKHLNTGYLAFKDSQGNKHHGFVYELAWPVLLKFVLQGDHTDPNAPGPFDDMSMDIPF